MSATAKTDRAYFWSNTYAQPKARSKFLIEFGSLPNGPVNSFDRIFNGKYEWLVKSVNRPKFNMEYEEYKNSISNAVIGAPPKSWYWDQITIKFVNPFSMTFWPRDLQKDLDLLLSDVAQSLIKREDNINTIPDNNEPNANVVLKQQQSSLSPISTQYLGQVVRIHDISMGFQSPALGSGGDEESNVNGQNQYDNKNNPSLNSLELDLGEMYSNGYWELYNPWITKIDWGDFDYASDEFIEISLTLKYQNAKYISRLREDQIGKDPDKASLRRQPTETQKRKITERDVAIARNSGLLALNDELKFLEDTTQVMKGSIGTTKTRPSSTSDFLKNRTLALQYEADKLITEPKKAK